MHQFARYPSILQLQLFAIQSVKLCIQFTILLHKIAPSINLANLLELARDIRKKLRLRIARNIDDLRRIFVHEQLRHIFKRLLRRNPAVLELEVVATNMRRDIVKEAQIRYHIRRDLENLRHEMRVIAQQFLVFQLQLVIGKSNRRRHLSEIAIIAHLSVHAARKMNVFLLVQIQVGVKILALCPVPIELVERPSTVCLCKL
mmetsp:Transcript_47058/g.75388  ORF Transcript_47058/g.75388 Transcript_47058/m.75388 type:complete len:202 (+) Transcript_47058:1247-1852(+)